LLLFFPLTVYYYRVRGCSREGDKQQETTGEDADVHGGSIEGPDSTGSLNERTQAVAELCGTGGRDVRNAEAAGRAGIVRGAEGGRWTWRLKGDNGVETTREEETGENGGGERAREEEKGLQTSRRARPSRAWRERRAGRVGHAVPAIPRPPAPG